MVGIRDVEDAVGINSDCLGAREGACSSLGQRDGREQRVFSIG
jgi:hypothetical protein